jgi:5-methylcytosine-specific restriction endonuclease McrA
MSNQPVNYLMPFKTCSQCAKTKPTTRENFGTKANGLPRAYCRECQRRMTNEYAARNREAGRERARQRKERLECVGVVNEHLQYRGQLLRDQKSKCYFCRDTITIDSIEVDHLTPISKGGTNEYANLAACCARCNKAKGNRTELEFKVWRENRLRFYK